MSQNFNNVRTLFVVFSDLFTKEIIFPVTWSLPFLPRIGEAVSGAILSVDNLEDLSEIKMNLSDSGVENFEKSKMEFEFWLSCIFSMYLGRVVDIVFHADEDGVFIELVVSDNAHIE